VPPTATSIPRVTATDGDHQCQMTIPIGFAEDSPGSGYFPALDKTGFVTVEAPDTAGGANTFDQAVATVLANLKAVLPGYQETNVARSPGGLRVDFVATLDNGPGKGTAYFKEFGPIICGSTLFLMEQSASPFDASLQGMVATLQVVKGAQPRPTATPLPPTPTPIPPTATPIPPTPKPLPTSTPTTAPRTASSQTWNGAPVYPGSVVYQDLGNSIVYAVGDSVSTVNAWYDRAWRAAGMSFVTTTREGHLTFRIYSYRGSLYGYAVDEASPGLTAVGLTYVK
jgi:hypothetical protein